MKTVSEAVISKMETTESSTNSPELKIFLKCLLMAGISTPNKVAIAFCVSQSVSS